MMLAFLKALVFKSTVLIAKSEMRDDFEGQLNERPLTAS